MGIEKNENSIILEQILAKNGTNCKCPEKYNCPEKVGTIIGDAFGPDRIKTLKSHNLASVVNHARNICVHKTRTALDS